MKIALIANYAADRQESMLRYAHLLADEFSARGHQVSLILPPARLLGLPGTKAPLAKWIAYIDKYLLAPPTLRREVKGADIVHICDHSNSMYLGAVGDVPKLITCHDTLAIFAARGRFPGITVGATGRLLQRWIAHGLTRAPVVVCVSAKTRRDVALLSGSLEAPRTVVIPNPVNPFFSPLPGASDAVLARHRLTPASGYFLHVGSNSWYKNRAGVVRIFAHLAAISRYKDSRLLLIGKPADQQLQGAIAESGAAARIHVLEGVEDASLRALYSDAEALLFPSREEGFGWPILEAQACGCVVVTSNRDPMREIAGGAAILVDPEEPSVAAQALEQAASDGSFPARREQGFKNVQRFQIGPVIDAYLDVYKEVQAAHVRKRDERLDRNSEPAGRSSD